MSFNANIFLSHVSPEKRSPCPLVSVRSYSNLPAAAIMADFPVEHIIDGLLNMSLGLNSLYHSENILRFT